ncbi:MAG: T9SS type A sorting domain-containing protein [Bacteroidota bacterium]|nr:T9SS type A sorting domain-containing protein [Bacteroidota bacterium]
MSKTHTSFLIGALLVFNFIKGQVVATNDTIPVIVHIINANETYGTGTNLDSVQVYSQFKILNNDFNGNGLNVSTVPAIWQSLVAHTGITFVPALYDPQGNLLPEKGIHRVPYTSIDSLVAPGLGYSQSTINNVIKPATIWDVNLYCNIWVLKLANGLNAYSTFPDSTGFAWITGSVGNALNDGLVINYKNFGDTLNVMNPYNKGRTATHEMGHWLGLIHMNDYCSNTPYLNDIWPANYSAISSIFSPHVYPMQGTECAGDTHGAMFMNFMCLDYDSTLVMFTQNQGDTMQYALRNAKYKHNLKNSWVHKPFNATGLKNKSEQNFSVYPNPSNGTIHLGNFTNGNSIEKIEIQNIQGIAISFEWDKISQVINFNDEDGIYFIKLNTKNGIFIKKLLINNTK